VAGIDVRSIRLNETIEALSKPVPSVGDYDEDAIPDLMVKFSRDEVKVLLPSPGTYTVEIIGTVNGVQFKGYDTVKVK